MRPLNRTPVNPESLQQNNPVELLNDLRSSTEFFMSPSSSGNAEEVVSSERFNLERLIESLKEFQVQYEDVIHEESTDISTQTENVEDPHNMDDNMMGLVESIHLYEERLNEIMDRSRTNPFQESYLTTVKNIIYQHRGKIVFAAGVVLGQFYAGLPRFIDAYRKYRMISGGQSKKSKRRKHKKNKKRYTRKR